MTKTELVGSICRKADMYTDKTISKAINIILEQMTDELNEGGRIEVRGFGSFCLHKWGPRHARHPVTGETWRTPSVHAVHFKPGKELRERVNAAYQLELASEKVQTTEAAANEILETEIVDS